MLETFTPAVCGSRKRQIVAQALFTGAAVLTAAALGLALGFAGSLLGGRYALYAAAGLALLAAAREAGLVRFPLPQARRQVPERWRFELPLPVWATGYGAGLGAGFFTFQPVSTFWVACAGALALARPLPAAACFALYGAGRAVMVVWPRRRTDDPTAAVERLTRRRGALLRANAVALVVCGILLAVAPAAGGATLVQQAAYDPSFSGGAIAFATKAGDVVVRPGGGSPDEVFSDVSQPSLDGQYLAVNDACRHQRRRLDERRRGGQGGQPERLAPRTRLAARRLRGPGWGLQAARRPQSPDRRQQDPRLGAGHLPARPAQPERRPPRLARRVEEAVDDRAEGPLLGRASGSSPERGSGSCRIRRSGAPALPGWTAARERATSGWAGCGVGRAPPWRRCAPAPAGTGRRAWRPAPSTGHAGRSLRAPRRSTARASEASPIGGSSPLRGASPYRGNAFSRSARIVRSARAPRRPSG